MLYKLAQIIARKGLHYFTVYFKISDVFWRLYRSQVNMTFIESICQNVHYNSGEFKSQRSQVGRNLSTRK